MYRSMTWNLQGLLEGEVAECFWELIHLNHFRTASKLCKDSDPVVETLKFFVSPDSGTRVKEFCLVIDRPLSLYFPKLP